MAPCLLWMLFSLRGGCAGGNIGIPVPGRDEKGRRGALVCNGPGSAGVTHAGGDAGDGDHQRLIQLGVQGLRVVAGAIE